MATAWTVEEGTVSWARSAEVRLSRTTLSSNQHRDLRVTMEANVCDDAEGFRGFMFRAS